MQPINPTKAPKQNTRKLVAFTSMLFVCYLLWVIVHNATAKPNIIHDTKETSYEIGYQCGIIVAKMDILTDNGTGEYKRLSDRYIQTCYTPMSILQDNIDPVQYIKEL